MDHEHWRRSAPRRIRAALRMRGIRVVAHGRSGYEAVIAATLVLPMAAWDLAADLARRLLHPPPSAREPRRLAQACRAVVGSACKTCPGIGAPVCRLDAAVRRAS